MQSLDICTPCKEHHRAESFFRHHRRLRAMRHLGQAWFCLADLARLMGIRLDERSTLKLDPDQRRLAWLECHSQWDKCVMISESGVFALLIHHYVPENRALRQWLTHEVLPELRRRDELLMDEPQVERLQWLGKTLLMLNWRNESWVRWQDIPNLIPQMPPPSGFWHRLWNRSTDRRPVELTNTHGLLKHR